METRKKKKKTLLKLLYRSFDTDLPPEEAEQLERELKVSETLRWEREAVQKMRKALETGEQPGFKPDFSNRVINRIRQPAGGNGLEQLYRSFRLVFRRLALAGAVLLFVLIIYNIHLGDNLSNEEVLYASESTVQEIMHVPLF